MPSTPGNPDPRHPAPHPAASPDAVPDDDAVLVLDASGAILQAGAGVTAMLGWTTDELAGRALSTLATSAGQALFDRSRAGDPLDGEELALHVPGGDRVVVRVTASAPDLSPWRVRWHLRDVTAERGAGDSLASLAAILNGADDAIINKRLDGVVTGWNAAAERLFGYTAAEMIGRSISTIMPPDQASDLPDIMARVARGERIDHFETVRRTRAGRLIDVSVTIMPIRNTAGRVLGACGITRDLTERRALERKQREFLAMVAHDLRSPLTSIKGFAQLMQRREAYSPAGMTAILTQVRHIERLVEDVLEITRLDENRQEVVFAPVDLAALARAVIGRIQGLLPGDRIVLHAPPQATTGVWDARRIEQALDHVVSNAVKYAPAGPIDVTLTAASDHVEITVRDHGPGIAPQDLPFVFERFYRAPGDMAHARGVGLGLAITRTLIEAHGGSVEIASTPGEGTQVSIVLPWDSSPDALSP